MSESKHTPGPWSIFGNPAHCVGGPFTGDDPELPGRDHAGIAMCGMRLRTNEECDANARLIAAAPELLAALHRLLDGISDLDDAARAAFPEAAVVTANRAVAACG